MIERKTDTRHQQEVETRFPTGPLYWSPTALRANLGAQPQFDKLRYAVVDDISFGTVLLMSYTWPTVTEAGSLNFEADERDELKSQYGWGGTGPGMPLLIRPLGASDMSGDGSSTPPRMDVEMFERLVNTLRTPERPLRVGDVYLMVVEQGSVRSHGKDSPPYEYVDRYRMWDITNDARHAAKAAQFSVVSPPMSEDELQTKEARVQSGSKWDPGEDPELEIVDVTIPETDSPDPRDARPAI